ncbi:MAG: glycosyltransferase [Hydrogenothermaceae bacterium]
MNKLKIMLYVNNLGRKSVNGTAITLLAKNLTDFLSKSGHDVLIVGNKDIVEEEINVPFLALKNGNKSGDIYYAKRLSEVIRYYKPDVIHAFMRPMSTNLALSTLFGKNLDSVYIGSIHNANNFLSYNKFYHLSYRFLMKKILSKLDWITAPSQAILNDVKKAYFLPEEKLEILPNFINFDKISQLAQEEIEEDIPEEYILNIGRLDYQKNHILLIKTFKKIVEEFPDEKLLIVGDGELRPQLEELVKQLSLEKNVFLIGYKNNPWKYYKKAKLFVLTSRFEGLPLVLIESLYFKVPIISFDIEPSKELTEGGKYGILVKSFDEGALHTTILNFLRGNFPVESLKEEGYKKALEFSLENYVNHLLRLINKENI